MGEFLTWEEKQEKIQALNLTSDVFAGKVSEEPEVLEEDAYCESLVEGYLNDTSEDKHDTVTIEEFAKSEGIML